MRPKAISEPMVRSVQTVHLSYVKIPHDPRHLGVPSAAFKMISKPMVCSAQTVHLCCIKISTISKWT